MYRSIIYNIFLSVIKRTKADATWVIQFFKWNHQKKKNIRLLKNSLELIKSLGFLFVLYNIFHIQENNKITLIVR